MSSSSAVGSAYSSGTYERLVTKKRLTFLEKCGLENLRINQAYFAYSRMFPDPIIKPVCSLPIFNFVSDHDMNKCLFCGKIIDPNSNFFIVFDSKMQSFCNVYHYRKFLRS